MKIWNMENAGTAWVDEPAFQEGNLAWGRVVADIPDYCRELVKALSD
jgi:protease I